MLGIHVTGYMLADTYYKIHDTAYILEEKFRLQDTYFYNCGFSANVSKYKCSKMCFDVTLRSK